MKINRLEQGPNEVRVRETMQHRLAGVLDALPMRARDCFAGLFNGALQHNARVDPRNDSLFIGKAECEWDWRESWSALQNSGLVTFTLTPTTYESGHQTILFAWDITEKGWKVREDDIAWYREFVAAKDADEKLEAEEKCVPLAANN